MPTPFHHTPDDITYIVEPSSGETEAMLKAEAFSTGSKRQGFIIASADDFAPMVLI